MKNEMTKGQKFMQLSGIIEYQDDDYGERNEQIILKDEKDIDLVDVFEEFISKNGNMLKVTYWISDKPCTKNEMVEGFINSFYGNTEAEYTEHDTASWTYGATSLDTYWKTGGINIGNHDLFKELSEKNGKFIIIEISTNTPPLSPNRAKEGM